MAVCYKDLSAGGGPQLEMQAWRDDGMEKEGSLSTGRESEASLISIAAQFLHTRAAHIRTVLWSAHFSGVLIISLYAGESDTTSDSSGEN